MKTLLRATNWVGDVVLSLPALVALRRSFPDDPLTVLARPWVADLYRLRPEPDEVLVDDSRGEHAGAAGRARLAEELGKRGFDRAILLPTSFGTAWTAYQAGIPVRIGYRGELRSPLLSRAVSPALARGRHQVWKHLRLVEAAGARVPDSDSGVDASWAVPPDLARAARERLSKAGLASGRFVAAHAASFAHQAKRWGVERFAELFLRLAKERGWPVVLLGSGSEKAMNQELAAALAPEAVVNLSGETTLPDVLGVVSLAALFVGNDSGLAHLAAAAGTPTVVVFGPTDPDATRPWGRARASGEPSNVRVVRRRTLCAPCRFTICPLDHACMTGVEVEDVLEAANEVLRPSNVSGGARNS